MPYSVEIMLRLWYNQNMSVRVKAYAKLNLTLSVNGISSGYHMIESLVCSVDLYDLIVIGKRSDGGLRVRMVGRGSEYMPTEENNAYKAAKIYQSAYKTGGADITVYKNIPFGAGMGGSSADAAGVLRGMAMLFGAGSESELKELADSLGSDTGYMLRGGFAVISGRGEKVKKIPCNAKLDFLLLAPQTPVSTAECYKLCDVMPSPYVSTANAVNALVSGDKTSLGSSFGNALYAPAARINPDVERAYNELKSFSPLGVNMTGSGSAVFALFESAEFCAWAKSRYRGKFECIQLKSVNP